jgi:hypothetical protein
MAWKACQGTDVLIESPSAMVGVHMAEKLGTCSKTYLPQICFFSSELNQVAHPTLLAMLTTDMICMLALP